MKELFSFKQFNIDQEGSAMKVGTDGVLLGAWTSLEQKPDSILDIGAGTGLIALMLAQRSEADTVDAIEIDEAAYEQSVENFEASPWGDRLFCYHAGLEEFVEEWDDTYDLIVSNPPFFEPDSHEAFKSKVPYQFEKLSGLESNSEKSHEKKRMVTSSVSPSTRAASRRTARFYDSLPFESLLRGVSRLLSPDGIFTTIIPYDEEIAFLALASKFGLHLQKLTRVKGNPASKIKRSLIQFGFIEMKAYTDELVIELERHVYTEEYRSLTKEFYLKM